MIQKNNKLNPHVLNQKQPTTAWARRHCGKHPCGH